MADLNSDDLLMPGTLAVVVMTRLVRPLSTPAADAPSALSGPSGRQR
jgi:hypothetical protein